MSCEGGKANSVAGLSNAKVREHLRTSAFRGQSTQENEMQCSAGEEEDRL